MSTKILNDSHLLLAQTLNDLLNRKENITPAALARKLGIPTNKITRILNGDVTDPKASTLLQIANYFGITIEQLLGLEPMSRGGVQGESSTSKQLPVFAVSKSDTQKAPLEWYHWVGNGIDSEYYALSVDTDLYEPTLYQNSLLIIDSHLIPEDRSFVVVRKKNNPGNFSIKKYVIDGNDIYFYPLNPQLSVEIFDESLYTISGVIIEVHQKLRPKK